MFGELEALGIHGSIILAGFSGGLCYVALQPGRPSPWGACSGLIVATLTSNYLSELAAHYIGLSGTSLGPAAFVTGLCSTWICKFLIKKASSMNPSLPGAGLKQDDQR